MNLRRTELSRALKRSDGRGHQAFSLIELIGVLAIMAILAAVLTPSLVRHMAAAKDAQEDQLLANLADGLKRYVRSTQQIPGAATWATNIASVLGLNANEVLRVDARISGNNRVYLIDPDFAPTSGSSPLYAQGNNGSTTAPSSARALIISSAMPSLSLPVSSGAAASTTVFNDIWNWSYDPATKAPPSGWPAAWSANGGSLHVIRINLVDLFHHVTFSNTQFPDDIPFAKFDGLTTYAFSSTNAIDRYCLEGTVIQLFKHDSPYTSPPANPDEMDLSHVITGDVNFLYQGNKWSVP